MRSRVSLLLGSGHPDARHYPVGMVWQEAYFVQVRENGRMATEAMLIHAAIAQAVGGGKALSDLCERLTEG